MSKINSTSESKVSSARKVVYKEDVFSTRDCVEGQKLQGFETAAGNHGPSDSVRFFNPLSTPGNLAEIPTNQTST
jgi:hypothetical protein